MSRVVALLSTPKLPVPQGLECYGAKSQQKVIRRVLHFLYENDIGIYDTSSLFADLGKHYLFFKFHACLLRRSLFEI